VTDERRSQQIGRRELDLWREHQIARCETQRTRLEALEREMRDGDRPARFWADKLTAVLNEQNGYWSNRLAEILAKHRESR